MEWKFKIGELVALKGAVHDEGRLGSKDMVAVAKCGVVIARVTMERDSGVFRHYEVGFDMNVKAEECELVSVEADAG